MSLYIRKRLGEMDAPPTSYIDKGGYKLRISARINPVYVFNTRIATIKCEAIDEGDIPKSILKQYCTRYSAENRQRTGKKVNFQINVKDSRLDIKKEPIFNYESSLDSMNLKIDNVKVKQEPGSDNMNRRVTRQMTKQYPGDENWKIQTTFKSDPEQTIKKAKKSRIQKYMKVESDEDKIKLEVESENCLKQKNISTSNMVRVTRQSARQALGLLNKNSPQELQTQPKAFLKDAQDVKEDLKHAVIFNPQAKLKIKQEPIDTVNATSEINMPEQNSYFLRNDADARQGTNTSNFDTRRVTRQFKKLHPTTAAVKSNRDKDSPALIKKGKRKHVASEAPFVDVETMAKFKKEDILCENEMLLKNLQDSLPGRATYKKKIKDVSCEEMISDNEFTETSSQMLEGSLQKPLLLKEEPLPSTSDNSKKNLASIDPKENVKIGSGFLKRGRNKGEVEFGSTRKHTVSSSPSLVTCEERKHIQMITAQFVDGCRDFNNEHLKVSLAHPLSTCTAMDSDAILRVTESADSASKRQKIHVKSKLNADNEDLPPSSTVNSMSNNHTVKYTSRIPIYEREYVKSISVPSLQVKIKEERMSVSNKYKYSHDGEADTDINSQKMPQQLEMIIKNNDVQKMSIKVKEEVQDENRVRDDNNNNGDDSCKENDPDIKKTAESNRLGAPNIGSKNDKVIPKMKLRSCRKRRAHLIYPNPKAACVASTGRSQMGNGMNHNSEILCESANAPQDCEAQTSTSSPSHILRDLISADGTMTVRTKTGYIVRVKVNVNQDRPDNFNTARDHMMWEVGTTVNALRLKAQIESGEYLPPHADIQVDTQPIEPVPATAQERAENLLRIKTNEAKFLGTELEMVNLIIDLRDKISKHTDLNSCYLLLGKLLALDVKPLMLKKHPDVVDTIHILCNFSSKKTFAHSDEAKKLYEKQVKEIKERAREIYVQFKALFSVPTGTTFYNYLMQCKDLLWRTFNYEAGRVFTIVDDPLP